MRLRTKVVGRHATPNATPNATAALNAKVPSRVPAHLGLVGLLDLRRAHLLPETGPCRLGCSGWGRPPARPVPTGGA